MTEAQLEQIWIKHEHGGDMDPKGEGLLVTAKGLQEDVNFEGRRQVTIIDADRWAKIQDHLGSRVDPISRRANLMISGIDLEDTKGKILVIGSTRLKIQGETKPCHIMDQAFQGLQAALVPHWGGGVYTEVLEGGALTLGDPVSWA